MKNAIRYNHAGHKYDPCKVSQGTVTRLSPLKKGVCVCASCGRVISQAVAEEALEIKDAKTREAFFVCGMCKAKEKIRAEFMIKRYGGYYGVNQDCDVYDTGQADGEAATARDK